MDILTIAGLGKAFGSQSVLDDLSFSVPEGSIYGFIGKNGSGKTTTMKIVLGLLLGTTTPKASASRCACLADCAKAFCNSLGDGVRRLG